MAYSEERRAEGVFGRKLKCVGGIRVEWVLQVHVLGQLLH